MNNKKCLEESQLYSCAIGFYVFVLFLCTLCDLYRNLSFLFSVAERMIWSCSSNWKGWFFNFFRTCCCDDVIVSTISLFIPTDQWLCDCRQQRCCLSETYFTVYQRSPIQYTLMLKCTPVKSGRQQCAQAQDPSPSTVFSCFFLLYFC